MTKLAPEPGLVVVAAEEPRADRVEGADPEIAHDLGAGEPDEALAHLARGLVGEGDGQDAIGRHVDASRAGWRCGR